MKQYFYWPNMYRRICQLLHTCDICQKAKTRNQHSEGPLEPTISKAVGDLVAVDFYGPLPKSHGRMSYILVAVNNFSKFLKRFPLKKANAVAAAYNNQRFTPNHQAKENTKRSRNTVHIKNLDTSIRHPQYNFRALHEIT